MLIFNPRGWCLKVIEKFIMIDVDSSLNRCLNILLQNVLKICDLNHRQIEHVVDILFAEPKGENMPQNLVSSERGFIK